MRARETLKQLLPPAVVKLLRSRRPPQQAQFIWAGVYSDFQDVPAYGPGHATETRIEGVKRSTSHALDKVQSNELRVSSEYALPPLLVSVGQRSGRRFSILDVGGGLGISYLYLRASIPALEKVHYEVMEVDQIARAGRELFAGDDEISFLTELPGNDAIGKFDLVQFCGSLQFFEDYESVIQRVCEYQPQFIYLLKTPVGEFPTFATAQYNLSKTVAPLWFFNRKTLVKLFDAAGYRLIYHGTHDLVYDTTNFEPDFRMDRYSHMLFAIKDRTKEGTRACSDRNDRYQIFGDTGKRLPNGSGRVVTRFR